ncbi:ABC transporter permease [Pseudomonas indica]|uniref:Putative ABC transport system permease protein n=1 Tax=Pseudomonas indica TaxID=137658 RepID=A0A1G9A2Y9_9PSED|nr:FtsX-like permease family protein [Pseudomonas indica]MBU3057947.1 FtsX-like permease family protein [Pseudomonas indica]SDK21713.1 putative ABC transport system permease protein [Pseudomonas indica]
MRPGLMAQLAWQDYRAEARLSVCAVLALVAVLAPLLVLFGLKFGLVTTLTTRLEHDPGVREIIPLAGGRFSARDVDELASRRDVAFALPRTRQIAATADLYPNGNGQALTVEMLPTAEGDPLVPPMQLPEAPDEVTLSQRAAEKLGLHTGDTFTAAFGRQRNGRQEYQRIPLRVKGVLPLEAFPRDALFSRTGLLEAAEDYRDGKDWPGYQPAANPNRVYPGFRLYARDLDSVERLRQLFAKRGLEVATQAAAIAQVRSLSRNLSLVFWIIASLALLGAFAAMTASALAAVERKRRALAVLRLLGFSTAALIAFVVLQSLYTGLFGVLLASGLYGVAQMGLNRLFETAAGEYACRLLFSHYLTALLATLSCCALASASGGWRAAQIEASEGLRDV